MSPSALLIECAELQESDLEEGLLKSAEFRRRLEELAAAYERLEARALLEPSLALCSYRTGATPTTNGAESPLNEEPNLSVLRSPSRTKRQSLGQESSVSVASVSVAGTTSGGHGVGGLHSRSTRGSRTSVPIRACFAAGHLPSPSSGVNVRVSSAGFSSGNDDERKGRWKFEAIDPSSRARLILDTCLFFCCVYDAAVVPYSLAWKPEKETISQVISCMASVAWICDMIMSFFTAYFSNGVMVTDLQAIAIRYLTRSFLFDACVNGADLVSIYMELVTNEESSSLRIFRILKLSRLARVVVVLRKHTKKQKLVQAESAHMTMLSLGLRLIAVLLFLNHLLCCAWFFIATNNDYNDTGHTWLDISITSDGLTYEEADVVFQYLTALHWSFTQMTPGSMSVVPQNSLERGYNVICLVVGLFVSSLLVSQLSAKMVRVQTLDHERIQQMDLLSRFLLEQSVHRSLAQRIKQQVHDRASAVKPLTMKDIPVLDLLPSALKSDLACAIYARSFLTHSVFYTWCVCNDGLIVDLSSKAALIESYSTYDDIFAPLQEGEKTYHTQGALKYRRQDLQSQESDDYVSKRFSNSTASDGVFDVEEHTWVSVVALWCEWLHVGTLQAPGPCQLVALLIKQVVEVLRRHPQVTRMNVAYARTFAELASWPEHSHTVELDLPPSTVLLAMPTNSRLTMSTHLLESFSVDSSDYPGISTYYPVKRNRLTTAQTDSLRDEIQRGHSIVILGEDHQLLRVVHLAEVCLMKPTGELLVHLGVETKSGNLHPTLKLPSTIIRDTESPADAAERLLSKQLPEALQCTTELQPEVEDEEYTFNKHFGVRSLLLKRIFCGQQAPPPRFRTSTAASSSTMRSSGFFRRESETSSSAAGMSGNPSMFTKLQVIDHHRCNGRRVFYAWMEPTEFERWSSPMLMKDFKSWIVDYARSTSMAGRTRSISESSHCSSDSDDPSDCDCEDFGAERRAEVAVADIFEDTPLNLAAALPVRQASNTRNTPRISATEDDVIAV